MLSHFLTQTIPANWEFTQKAKFNRHSQNLTEFMHDTILKLHKKSTECTFDDQLARSARGRLPSDQCGPEIQETLLVFTNAKLHYNCKYSDLSGFSCVDVFAYMCVE